MRKNFFTFFVIGLLCTFFSSLNAIGEDIDTQQNQLINSEIIIHKGTVFETKTDEDINLKNSRIGKEVDFILMSNFIIDNIIIFPRGSIFKGVITDISRNDLLNDNINIVIDINYLSGVVGKKYELKAHPELPIIGHKKKKGYWLKFGFAGNSSNNNAMANALKEDNNKYTRDHNNIDDEEKSENEIIRKYSKINIVLDNDMKVKLKE